MPCVLDPRGYRETGCIWGCLRRAGSAVEDPSRLQAELGAPLVAGHGAAGTVEVGGARAPGVEVGVGRQKAPYWRGQCGGVLEDSGGDSRIGHVRVCLLRELVDRATLEVVNFGESLREDLFIVYLFERVWLELVGLSPKGPPVYLRGS